MKRVLGVVKLGSEVLWRPDPLVGLMSISTGFELTYGFLSLNFRVLDGFL